jgi:3-oxoacyl-[acyl-carrier protein] reductase
MDLGLRDRVYVVTGGTRGLGRAAAEALVTDGARVVVSSRDDNAVRDAVSELGGPDHAAGISADNADEATPGRLVAAAREAFRRLDGALISVGGPPPGDVVSTTDDQWRAAFDSVFLGAVRLARELAGVLDEGGAIGFVLSTSVQSPIAGLAVSNGLRPGLAMVAKTLADELGPRGIRVFGLLPGRLSTARMLELTPDEQTRRGLAEQIPLRRFGEPAEFGRVAAFLLSPAASYLTGVMLPVDGGALRAL